MHNNRKYRHGSSRAKSHKLPERWDKYTDMGNIVPGTRFLPFKTPLKEEICKKSLSESNWFTPAMLLEKAPKIKLVIDLTQTDRYYPKEYLLENGVQHKKILCPGGGKQLPPHHIIHEFNRAIDGFLASEEGLDGDALIGVHCTHGLNRTGYLICKYMVLRSGVSAEEAILAFENARGHKMERDVYVNDILGNHKIPYPPHQPHPQRHSYKMINTHHDNRFNPVDTHHHRRSSPLGSHHHQRYSPVDTHRQQLYSPLDTHHHQRYSPLDGCYSERRRSYSDRNIFYPNFK